MKTFTGLVFTNGTASGSGFTTELLDDGATSGTIIIRVTFTSSALNGGLFIPILTAGGSIMQAATDYGSFTFTVKINPGFTAFGFAAMQVQ